MKRTSTLLVATVMSASVFAQTVLWDGESAELGTLGGLWDRSNPTVVENPDKSGINTSDKCIKFTMNGDENKQIAIPFRDWMNLDLKGNRRISMMIRRTGTSNVLVELSDPTNEGADGYWVHEAAWYGTPGEWMKIVLDFTPNNMNDYPGVIAITASTDAAGENEDVYIDNVVVEDVPMVNGVALKDIQDGCLSGNLTLAGSWMKGECSNTDAGWTKVTYDDFTMLKTKMSADVTEVDMQGVVLKEPYDVFMEVNPDMVVKTSEPFGESANILVVKNLTMSDAGYATYYGDKDLVLAEGLQAGIITEASNSGLNICYRYNAENDVPANTGVLLKGDKGEYPCFYRMGNKAEAAEGNLLKGSVTEALTEGEDCLFYKLAYDDNNENLGFYWSEEDGAAFTCAAGKAYLALPWSMGVNARSLLLDDIADVTAIDGVEAGATSVFVKVYTIDGRIVRTRVAAPRALDGLEKGLYIVNGKKYMVR